MYVRLDHIEKLASNIRMFWFEPERSVRYVAGQYIELTLPTTPVEKRWFTLSSSPSEPLLAITTKHATGVSSDFKNTLWNFKPGVKLQVSEPMGDFVLPKDKTIPLVFVAGGIGVTPFRSIIKWLLDTGEKRSIQLLYAANVAEELIFKDLFQAYGLQFIPVVAEAPPNWSGETGRLDAQRIVDLTKPSANSLIYLAGPEPMVEVLADNLPKLGIEKSRLVTDFFPGYKRL